MTEVSVKRLSKVAREFNLSVGTIVDFLFDKGHEVEPNPNAKITPEMYDLLSGSFQADKIVREESNTLGLNAKKETVEDTPAQPQPSRKVEEEQEDIVIKNLENAVSEFKTPTVVQQVEEKQVEEKNVTIVGKIDLDKFAKKPKKEKEKEAPVAKVKEEVVVTPEPPVQAIVEEKVKVEEKKEEVIEPEAKPASPAEAIDTTIRVKVDRLEGPKILSRIDLPAEKKRTPGFVSAEQKAKDDLERKKRKRIIKTGPNKIDLDKASKEITQNKKKEFAPGDPASRRVYVAPTPTVVDPDKIQKEIRETLARLSSKGKSKSSKHRKAKRESINQQLEESEKQKEIDKSTLQVTEFVTANQLANMMSVPVTEIISACMSLGMFVSINQRLDAETLSIVAEEFGFKVEFTTAEVQESIQQVVDKPEDLMSRPPIVTVMGHVDHGKTSLLDYIRKTNVISGEAGGITQHIGAYSVQVGDGKITFLDTPGHEAFTAMRARGAQITDIAIIVIAADDSVMPQTREAINHAQAAGVPMIFAFNKIDKPGANTDKIKEELSTMNILVEDWGGKYQSQEISAKKGLHIDLLLEKVLLEAELLDLKANPNKLAIGSVIESSLDKGRGYVSTLLVQSGTLKIGDAVVAGSHWGKIKAMFNEKGEKVMQAGPSSPVSVLGLDGAPSAGDRFNVMEDEKEAKSIAFKRQQLVREQGIRSQKHITLDEIGRRLAIGDFRELNVIVKGDVDGSIEALADSLLKLSTEKIQVNVIHKSVGQISESDVLLASASDAIILGFQVRPSNSARKLAEKEEIDVRLYSVIYDAIEEVKAAMEGMLAPKIEEKIVCNIEVRDVFKITNVGTVAGCYVLDGKVTRKTKIRLIRDGIVLYTGMLGSLKRFKDDVKEVAAGYECGLNIEKFNDIKVGDIIEGYEETEVMQKL